MKIVRFSSCHHPLNFVLSVLDPLYKIFHYFITYRIFLNYLSENWNYQLAHRLYIRDTFITFSKKIFIFQNLNFEWKEIWWKLNEMQITIYLKKWESWRESNLKWRKMLNLRKHITFSRVMSLKKIYFNIYFPWVLSKLYVQTFLHDIL